jgi:hypothetical protein
VNPVVGWGLAAAALAVGWAAWGWPGIVLAVTAIVFWLLLQFSRTLRVLRRAGSRPMGQVDSAVMLHARLHAGQRLIDILPLAGSLGREVPGQAETFEWADASGAVLRARLTGGRLSDWSLRRDADPAT